MRGHRVKLRGPKRAIRVQEVKPAFLCCWPYLSTQSLSHRMEILIKMPPEYFVMRIITPIKHGYSYYRTTKWYAVRNALSSQERQICSPTIPRPSALFNGTINQPAN